MTTSQTTWLQRLALEITEKTGKAVSEPELYAEFRAFRQACTDRLLLQSYRSDVHHFRRGNRPQARTLDIILSFMDQRYDGLRTPLVAELAAALDEHKDRRRYESETEKVLAKERYRRWRPRSRKKDTYWDLNRKRIVPKYIGLYALLRVSSGNHLLAEPFALAPQREDPSTLSMYWICNDGLRVGDLIANTSRFSGTSVCKSTDRVLEPISVSVLRAPHRLRPDGSKLLVLGGVAVGLKDKDEEALFYCRLALIKCDDAPPTSLEHFQASAASRPIRDLLQRLSKDPATTERLRPSFLLGTSSTIRSLDAADVLGEVSDAFARQETSGGN